MADRPVALSQSGGSGGVQATAEAYGTALSLPGACPHCSSPWSATIHSGPCPRIKAIEYHSNGTVKRIELVPPVPPLARTGEHTPRGRSDAL